MQLQKSNLGILSEATAKHRPANPASRTFLCLDALVKAALNCARHLVTDRVVRKGLLAGRKPERVFVSCRIGTSRRVCDFLTLPLKTWDSWKQGYENKRL